MLAARHAIPVWNRCRLVDALTASDHASACLDAIRADAAGVCHTSDAHVHYDTARISDTQDSTLDQPSLFDTHDLDTTPAAATDPSTDALGETAPRPLWFVEPLLTTAEAFQLADTGRPVTNPFAQRTRDDNDADVTRLRAELAIIDHHDTPTVRSGRTRPRPWRAEPVT